MEPPRTLTYRLYTRDQRRGRTNSAGSGFGSANSKGPPPRKLSELPQHLKVTAEGLGEAIPRRRSTRDPQLLGQREKGSIDQAASLGTPLCSFGPIGMRGPETVPERAGPTFLATTPTNLIPTPPPRRPQRLATIRRWFCMLSKGTSSQSAPGAWLSPSMGTA